MAITWRNVNAPNLSDVTQLQKLGQESINRGLSTLQKAGEQYGARQDEIATNALRSELLNLTSDDQFAEFKSRVTDPNLIKEADARQQTLLNRSQAAEDRAFTLSERQYNIDERAEEESKSDLEYQRKEGLRSANLAANKLIESTAGQDYKGEFGNYADTLKETPEYKALVASGGDTGAFLEKAKTRFNQQRELGSEYSYQLGLVDSQIETAQADLIKKKAVITDSVMGSFGLPSMTEGRSEAYSKLYNSDGEIDPNSNLYKRLSGILGKPLDDVTANQIVRFLPEQGFFDFGEQESEYLKEAVTAYKSWISSVPSNYNEAKTRLDSILANEKNALNAKIQERRDMEKFFIGEARLGRRNTKYPTPQERLLANSEPEVVQDVNGITPGVNDPLTQSIERSASRGEPAQEQVANNKKIKDEVKAIVDNAPDNVDSEESALNTGTKILNEAVSTWFNNQIKELDSASKERSLERQAKFLAGKNNISIAEAKKILLGRSN